MNNKNLPTEKEAVAGIFRHIAAICYDALIIIALLFIASVIPVALNHGKAIPAQNIYFSMYLVTVWFGYFVYSWIKSGQTVGMRAWKLTLRSRDGGPIDVWQAMMRFGFAIPALLLFGAGIWWKGIDRDKLAWQDRWSKTYLQLDTSKPCKKQERRR